MRNLFPAAFLTLLAASAAAQTTGRVNFASSAPVPGTTFRVTIQNPAKAAGNAYAWMASLHTDARIYPPRPWVGALRIDPNAVLLVPGGKLKVTPTTDSFAIPNNVSLIGALVDLQSVDHDAKTDQLLVADNEIVVNFVKDVGTTTFAMGVPGKLDMTLRTVTNANAGSPAVLATYEPQKLTYVSETGFGQGYAHLGGVSNNVDPAVLRKDRVLYNETDVRFRKISLPNGREFAVMRDANKPKEFVVITIDRKTGKVTELSGSRIASVDKAARPINPYAETWQFTKDGSIAFGTLDNIDPPAFETDRIVMIRTDNTNWPGKSSATLILVPPAAAGAYAYLGNGNIMVGNGLVFYRGLMKGNGKIIPMTWVLPIDGSRAPVLFGDPNLGTNAKSESLMERSFRVSEDGRTIVFPIAKFRVFTGWDYDLVSITNISKTTMQVRNITAFANKATTLRWNFGKTRGYAWNNYAQLSKDGSRIAFIGGNGGTANKPDVLYVARTDGSDAGKVTPARGFAAGTNFMGTPYFLANGDVLVFAGKTRNQLDLYRVKADLSGATNLTNRGDMIVPWTLVSKSGWFYFARDFEKSTTSLETNLIGVNPQTGALVDITGSEFNGGGARGMALESLHFGPLHYLNEFRMRPGNSTEMYFIGREVVNNKTYVYTDDNVWKFDFEKGTKAVKLTSFRGTGALSNRRIIKNLALRADGGFAFSIDKTARLEEHVMYQAPGKQMITLNDKVFADLQPVLGQRSVVTGSLRLTDNSCVWVNGGPSGSYAVGCYAQLDANSGHATYLTGLPWPQNVVLLTFSGQ